MQNRQMNVYQLSLTLPKFNDENFLTIEKRIEMWAEYFCEMQNKTKASIPKQTLGPKFTLSISEEETWIAFNSLKNSNLPGMDGMC